MDTPEPGQLFNRADTGPDRADQKEVLLMEEGMIMQILSIVKDGRWKNDAIPVYYTRKIKVSKSAVAKWYSRKSSPDPEEVQPME